MKILRVMPVLALTLALALLSASCGFGLGIMDYDKATISSPTAIPGVIYRCSLDL